MLYGYDLQYLLYWMVLRLLFVSGWIPHVFMQAMIITRYTRIMLTTMLQMKTEEMYKYIKMGGPRFFFWGCFCCCWLYKASISMEIVIRTS